jgi:hypothetical protein
MYWNLKLEKNSNLSFTSTEQDSADCLFNARKYDKKLGSDKCDVSKDDGFWPDVG